MENKTVYSATLSASQEAQKKDVQRTGILSCALVLVVAAVTNFGTFLLGQLEKDGIGANLSDGMQMFFQDYFIYFVADVAAILFGILFFGKMRRNKEMKKEIAGDKKLWWFGILAAPGVSMIGAELWQLCTLPAALSAQQAADSTSTLPYGELAPMILIGVYCCLVAPVLEEILFRGIIQRAMESYGAMTAILTSTLCFVLFHFNPEQLFTPLLMGLFAGFLAYRSRSLIPCIVAHILNNLLALLPEFLAKPGTGMYVALSTAFDTVSMALGLLFLVLFACEYGKNFLALRHLESEQTGCTTAQKMRKVICNPTTIFLLLIYLVQSTWLVYQTVR